MLLDQTCVLKSAFGRGLAGEEGATVQVPHCRVSFDRRLLFAVIQRPLHGVADGGVACRRPLYNAVRGVEMTPLLCRMVVRALS